MIGLQCTSRNYWSDRRLGSKWSYYRDSARGFFADDGTLVPNDAAEYLAEQIGVRADELSGYDFGGRTARRHCAEILQYLGFRRIKRADWDALSVWIVGELCPSGQSVSTMLEAVFLWCRFDPQKSPRRPSQPHDCSLFLGNPS